MKNLTTAIYGLLAGSTLTGLISARLYEDEAPPGTEYPYVVYSVIGQYKEKTFTEEYNNFRVQFSIFSTNEDATEIQDIYQAVEDLYDECAMTITGSRLLWMRLDNVTNVTEAGDNPDGTMTEKHVAVEFDVKTSLN